VDAVGGEEAVVNPVAQAVSVNGIPEIEVGVAVVLAQRRGGQPKLKRRFEPCENVPPGGILARAPSMALVHDDEVEEIGGKLLVEAGPASVFGQRLVNGEIDFPALDHLTTFDLVPGVPERGEHLVLGVVDENVPIREIEDLRASMFPGAIPTRVPKLPTNLKRDRGLARPRGHGDQLPALPLENALDRAVNGDLLVVALSFAH